MRGEEVKPLIFIATYIGKNESGKQRRRSRHGATSGGKVGAPGALSHGRGQFRVPHGYGELQHTAHVLLSNRERRIGGRSGAATALHFVYTYKKISDVDCFMCAGFLVEEKGADPTLRCRKGHTPAVFARRREKMQTYRYLMQRGSRRGRQQLANQKRTKSGQRAADQSLCRDSSRGGQAGSSKGETRRGKFAGRTRGGRGGGHAGQDRKEEGKGGEEKQKRNEKNDRRRRARDLTVAMGSLGLAWRGEGV